LIGAVVFATVVRGAITAGVGLVSSGALPHDINGFLGGGGATGSGGRLGPATTKSQFEKMQK